MKEKFTLEDTVVKEVLKAVSKIEKDSQPMVAGGMANQLYAKDPKTHRATSDIDLAPKEPISNGDFAVMIGNTIESHLKEKGYDSKQSKTRYSYEICIDCEGGPFYFHINRYSKNFFERMRVTKERELSNAVAMSPDFLEGGQIMVVRPEDIVAGKIKRLKISDRQGIIEGKEAELYERLKDEDFGYLAAQPIAENLPAVEGERSKLINEVKKENFSENTDRLNRFKVRKDFYDMCLLFSGVIKGEVPFDKDYYHQALSEMNNFTYKI